MRKIGVVSVGRSDYGIYLPILRAITGSPDLELCLIATGTHLSPLHGTSVQDFEADGFVVAEKVEMLMSSDSPEGIVKSMGVALLGFAGVYSRQRPDILAVLGDRFEMHAAALAALPFKIPVAHIHGGEETVGAFDNSLRHSITKLSHLHFAATEDYARRIIQLGEEPWRVMVVGAPSLDNLRSLRLLTPSELAEKWGVPIGDTPLLVTFHPATLEHEDVEQQMSELLAALELSGMPSVLTMPNADPGNHAIRRMITEYAAAHPASRDFENLGIQGYFSMMAVASAMVGNSSSGIIEAASFGLPVVNIGTRQKGRFHPANVLDVGCDRTQILKGIEQATSHQFRESLRGLANPYGDGHAAERIVEKLRTVALGDRLISKPFHDLPRGDVS